MSPDLIERRISLVATIGAVVVFLLLALLAPAGFPSGYSGLDPMVFSTAPTRS